MTLPFTSAYRNAVLTQILLRGLAVSTLIACLTPTALAVGPKSASYSLDYVASATGGSVSQTASYNVVTRVRTKGFVLAPCSSTRYAVSPLIGSSVVPVASVTQWSKY